MKALQRFLLIFHTLRYLKFRQIYYQAYYRFRRFFPPGTENASKLPANTGGLKLSGYIAKASSYADNSFTFLNLEKKYLAIQNINWDEPVHGKLWTYNLNYFDFLLQPEMDTVTGNALIGDFISKYNRLSNAKEAYPISLRGINWIKWLSKPELENFSERQTFELSLWQQYQTLANHIEYHLLGNHLLENAFSLLFGAFYFSDRKLYVKAREILLHELNEQLLPDGAHFELSPMYHQIMLDRTLDCIHLLQCNARFSDQGQLLEYLKMKAGLMLGWLKAISFTTGDIPMVNDSAPGIAPATPELLSYASTLGVKETPVQLEGSGYRMFRFPNYELIVDFGKPGPDYIPGHAHADVFNFMLHINGEPMITDTGISTYNSNNQRLEERSTAAHNTVMVNGTEQSEVWSSFRMARRIKPIIRADEHNRINGYYKGITGYVHEREFRVTEKVIEIRDDVREKMLKSEAFLHFEPELTPELNVNTIVLPLCTITFTGSDSISLEKYNFAEGFNLVKPAYLVRILFTNKLITKIEL